MFILSMRRKLILTSMKHSNLAQNLKTSKNKANTGINIPITILIYITSHSCYK